MAYGDKVVGAESSGNDYAKNPSSSAYGPHQFIAGTWLGLVKKYRPDLMQGRSTQEVLALRSNRALSSEMNEHFSGENATYLKARGYEPTDDNLYLAHFAGPKGAAELLANPDVPAASILSNDALEANPFLRNWKAGDVAAWAGRKMGWQPLTSTQSGGLGGAGRGAPVPATATPDAAAAASEATPQPKRGNDAVLPMLASLFNSGAGAGGAGGLASMLGGSDLAGLGKLFGGEGAKGGGGLLDSLMGGDMSGGEGVAPPALPQAGRPGGGWLPQRPVDMSGLQAMLAKRPMLGMMR